MLCFLFLFRARLRLFEPQLEMCIRDRRASVLRGCITGTPCCFCSTGAVRDRLYAHTARYTGTSTASVRQKPSRNALFLLMFFFLSALRRASGMPRIFMDSLGVFCRNYAERRAHSP